MNNNITPAHVTYEQAVWLKSIGFDLPCNKMYGIDASLEYFDNSYGAGSLYRNSFNVDFITAAPEQSVVVEWLRVNFQVNVTYTVEVIGSDEWRYGYMICYLPFGFWSEKRRSIHFQTVYSFCEVGSSYTGAWDSPSEAISAALSYLMSNEIIKQK